MPTTTPEASVPKEAPPVPHSSPETPPVDRAGQTDRTDDNPEKHVENHAPPDKKTPSEKAAVSTESNTPIKNEKPQPAATPAKPFPKVIIWADEQQKKRCETLLADLQELFLKTRHYSIVGAPCQTNENAASFLRIGAMSRQECPAGLLEQHGYTERIIRNITYLEKLGKDRCSEDQVPVDLPSGRKK